jgi:hypothetical protein
LGRGPAALAFSHQQIFGENNLDYLAASWPGAGMNSWAWGLSVNRLGYAVQERRGADRSVSGSFGSSDLSVGLSVAKSIGFLNVGTQIKMIHQDLAGYTANGMAVDLGLQSPTPFSRLSMGLAVRNIGPQMKFVTEEYHLPLMISGGVAYKMIQPLTLVFDIQHSPYQQQTSAALGLEFAPLDSITMRAGYLNKIVQAVNNNQASETNRGNIGGIGGLSGGLGFKVGQFSMDYAIAPFGELGTNHVFTVTTTFGKTSAPRVRAPQAPSAVEKQDEKPQTDNRDIVIFPPADKTFGQEGSGSTLPE